MINILKEKKKLILIGIVILFLIIIARLSYITVFTYISNREDVILEKDLSCEFRQEVYLSDFIKTLNGKIVEDTKIDTNEIGIKKVTLSYQNRYGFISKKSFEIEVRDITAPTVVVKNTYIVEVNSIENLIDTIFCADDYDDNVKCIIKGNYNLNKVGEYPLTITATDHSNNRTEKDFTLKIIEKTKDDNKTTLNSNYTSFKEVLEKYKNKNTSIGLDLSKWQGDVEFGKLKEQGVEFVMLKIGGQREIKGEFIIDPKFKENLKQAKKHNIKVGVYFYSYAKEEKEARKQAKWIISILEEEKLDLPIVFDWENWNKYTTFHISFHTLNKIASAFMKEVENAGYESMLYSSKYYLETIWYRENYKVWLAYYTKNNDYQEKYLLWQLCSDGKIEGIEGFVDIDIMYHNN